MITYLSLGSYGRLGNQLFQIAATIGLAKKLEHKAVFPNWQYSKFFPVDICDSNMIYSTPWVNIQESDFTYNPIISELDPKRCVNLFGYFQSEKYFEHCRDDIKKIIDTDNNKQLGENALVYVPLHTTTVKFSELKKRPEDKICAIHIRRGDYLNLPQHYAQLTETQYYNKAIQYIYTKYLVNMFIIFSDDIEWCKTKIHDNKVVYSRGNEIEDLMMQRSCDYHIIANSSFSWWGSWNVNSNCVIAPKQWFGPAIPNDTKDLYRDDMVIL